MIKLKLTNPGCGVKFRFACNQIKFNVGQLKGPVVPHVGGVGPAGKNGTPGIQGVSGTNGSSTFLELTDTPIAYPIPVVEDDHWKCLIKVKHTTDGLEFTDQIKAGTF